MIKKILITGSKGMLGKNIINDQRFKKFKLINLSREKFNLKNQKKMIYFLKKFKPDLVIHCAAKVGGIGDNFKNNLKYFKENVDINNSVILSAKEVGIKKLINFGSSCMYPVSAKKPLKESYISINNLEKTNIGYALSKIVAIPYFLSPVIFTHELSNLCSIGVVRLCLDKLNQHLAIRS